MLKNKGSMRGGGGTSGGSGARYGVNTGDFSTKSLKSSVILERSTTYASKKRSENASTSSVKGKDPKLAVHSPPGFINAQQLRICQHIERRNFPPATKVPEVITIGYGSRQVEQK